MLHDVQIGGSRGLLPLCADMPVKFTENVCREEKIYTHTIGRLKEIVFSETMAAEVGEGITGKSASTTAQPPRPPVTDHESLTESEIILSGLPEGFVVEVTEGHEEPYQYFLKPETGIWYMG